MPPRRLDRHPLTTIARGAPVEFHRNGKRVSGFANEPLAVALYARGDRVLSRSMRYHRARGYFCGTGQCTHCFVRLNGVPNVRSCLAPCEPNAWIEDQNALFSVENDWLAAADLAFPQYLDAHRAFVRPAFLKPVYTRLIRGMAGFGRVPQEPVPQSFRHESLSVDACVVGSGPAGLAAALALVAPGLKVLLVEREARLGGRLPMLPTPFHATSPQGPRVDGKEFARDRETELRTVGVDMRSSAILFGIYPGLHLAAATPTALLEVQARALVLATGALDAYAPFPGSDRAGVLLASGALRLLNEHGVLPGERVAIVGAERAGLLLARDLLACGARVAALTDPRPAPARPDPLLEDLRRLGLSVRWGTRPERVIGRKAPRALEVRGERTERIDCDAVVLAGPRHAAIELFQQAGCPLAYDPARGGFVPRVDADLRTAIDGIWAAGAAAGAQDEWESHLMGRVAGLAARAKLMPDEPDAAGTLAAAQQEWDAHRSLALPPPLRVMA